MSQLFVFEEKQNYINYNGELNIHKYNLYVPLVLNKRYIYICDDPFSPRFSCTLVTRRTRVMEGVHIAFATNSLQWRTCKRTRYLG
jgi:hypothetical protein